MGNVYVGIGIRFPLKKKNLKSPKLVSAHRV